MPGRAAAGYRPRGVYAVLVFQQLMASGTHIVAKVVLQDVDPFTLTVARTLISTAAMALILILRGKAPAVRREDYPMFLWLAFLGVPLNQFLFLYGLRFTIPSNAALLYATTPVIVLVFSHFFLGEKLTRLKAVGVVLGFAGVTIVIFERGLSASMDYLFGNVMIFIAVIAWALYTVYGRKMIVKYGPIETSALSLIGGTILFLPVGIFSALRFPFASLTAAHWLGIGYLSIVTSVISYLLWYYALGRIEAGKVALFSNFQPIIVTALAVTLLGQTITIPFVLGGCIAIAGVVAAQFG